MSRPKIRVQHAVLCHTTRQYGSNLTSDLLGVQYTFTYSPDQEFPRHLPQLDVFTRFFIDRHGGEDFYIRVWRLVSADRSDLMNTFGPFNVQFSPGIVVSDRHFRLRNVRVEGTGAYLVKLCRKVSKGWKGKRFQVLKSESFQVERYP